MINAAAVAMFGKGLSPAGRLHPFVGTGETATSEALLRNTISRSIVPQNGATKSILTWSPGAEAFPGHRPGAFLPRRTIQIAVASSADEIKIVANLKKIGLTSESGTLS
jgi:hypothetical protein